MAVGVAVEVVVPSRVVPGRVRSELVVVGRVCSAVVDGPGARSVRAGGGVVVVLGVVLGK